MHNELAARVADLTCFETIATRIAVDRLAWRLEEERADAADRALIPAAVAREAEGDGVSLGEMLRESGLDERELKQLMARHSIAFDAVKTALTEMERAAEARHAELRSYLRGNVKDRPADVIDWVDLDFNVASTSGRGGGAGGGAAQQEQGRVVAGEGAFGQVLMGRWHGNTVAVKMLNGVFDGKALEKARARSLPSRILPTRKLPPGTELRCFFLCW